MNNVVVGFVWYKHFRRVNPFPRSLATVRAIRDDNDHLQYNRGVMFPFVSRPMSVILTSCTMFHGAAGRFRPTQAIRANICPSPPKHSRQSRTGQLMPPERVLSVLIPTVALPSSHCSSMNCGNRVNQCHHSSTKY